MSRSTTSSAGRCISCADGNDNHVVQVDGVDAGSFRQNWPGQYLGLSSEAIEDIQIKTAGVDASAPLAEGMVINIATPSGTNQVKGSVGAVYTAIAWNDNNTPGGTPVVSRTVQPDLALGGPLLRSRAWFFGTFRYTNRLTGISRSSALLDNLEALVPGFDPFNNEGRLKFGSLKGTTQLTPNHHFQVTYQRDANVEETNLQVNGANVQITALGGATYGTRLSSVWGDRVTTKILVGFNDKSNISSIDVFDGHLGSGPSRPVHSSSFVSAGLRTGSDLSRCSTISTPAGSTGVENHDRADLTTQTADGGVRTRFRPARTAAGCATRRRRSTPRRVALEECLRDPAIRRGRCAIPSPLLRRRLDHTSRLRARDSAVYVQDSWKPGARLTINAGLRVDFLSNARCSTSRRSVCGRGPRIGGNYSLTPTTRIPARQLRGRRRRAQRRYIGGAGRQSQHPR